MQLFNEGVNWIGKVYQLMFSQKTKKCFRCFTQRDLCMSAEKAGGKKMVFPRVQ